MLAWLEMTHLWFFAIWALHAKAHTGALQLSADASQLLPASLLLQDQQAASDNLTAAIPVDSL